MLEQFLSAERKATHQVLCKEIMASPATAPGGGAVGISGKGLRLSDR